MFSANENLMLREYKRRVVYHVEATIPESIVDLGTSGHGTANNLSNSRLRSPRNIHCNRLPLHQ
eukprot:scaffold6574_cov261-Chaetoceros_neogracile.AAC.6